MRKIKALLLGHSDTLLPGHAFHAFHTMPDCFDKRIVLYRGSKENEKYVLYPEGSLKFKFVWRYKHFIFILKSLLHSGEYLKKVPKEKGYYYLANEDVSESANTILKKCGNFKPEIIFVYWVSEFVSYKTIRHLHEKTGAFIVILFVDQAPLGGGCHYPIDCDGYITGCQKCPALLFGKKVASYNLRSKIESLKNLPHAIVGTPSDLTMAKRTLQFKDSVSFEYIKIPEVEFYDKSQSRIFFDITDDEFVILLGAQNINDVRKGFKYGLEAINYFEKNAKNVTILALGNKADKFIFNNINARIIQPGFLNFSDMCKAYCASDCYLNPTIADSGPMMVNYALALGLPTISFPIGIANTLVKEGETGYFAEYKNSISMADKLSLLYSKSIEERLQININCKKMAEEFSKKKPVEIQIYEYYIENY